MNFTQMHERLRLELQRRIQRGTLSVSLLSRQTGFGKSHVSNFLHSRSKLSLDSLDRVLASQHMAVEHLIDFEAPTIKSNQNGDRTSVPLVSHNSAIFEPEIRPAAVQMMLQLPQSLHSLKTSIVASRRAWQRWVAIRIDHADAAPMDPLLYPNAVAVIDRHYNSLRSYRPARPNLYAVRNGAHLTLRYADYLAMRLVLRPLNTAYPIDLIEISPNVSPSEFIAGRVALILNEL